MKKELNFIITYGKDTFFFKQGSKAFILHTGIENEIDKNYGIQCLREYTTFVHDCYHQAVSIRNLYRHYEKKNRTTNRPLINPFWEILPITKKEILAGIWNEPPFKKVTPQ